MSLIECEWELMRRQSKKTKKLVLGLTDDLKVSDLTDHRIGVHLTHVVAAVFLLHTVDVQQPCFGVVVRYTEAWHPGDDMSMYCQDHLTIYVNPCDLQAK